MWAIGALLPALVLEARLARSGILLLPWVLFPMKKNPAPAAGSRGSGAAATEAPAIPTTDKQPQIETDPSTPCHGG
ncbi:hypothetical protein NLM27_06000 [Bradyrhizobium sp. CCGB12]|uniref:hypothetical protein n=1 Tax=Bradyrhizobium sp. CCGB12 TaxID=2949632 RepID=UPI0020B3DDBC|nr:hypothetical protein [Bradyrhizobium sp. CCGB12]MCP3388333.1 hypothetical protein [Bradyrhizobium sp. CCGB12]